MSFGEWLDKQLEDREVSDEYNKAKAELRPCKNEKCGELHISWADPEQKPAPHRMLEDPYIYCSLTCAAADGAWSAREGWKI